MAFNTKVGLLLGCVAVLAAQSALADTISVTGDNCSANCVTYNDTGTTPTALVNTISFGSLTNPVNVTFADNLGTNSSGGSISTTDNYIFSVPATSASATISGDQVWLKGFSGTVDSFSLINTSTGVTVMTGTELGPFSSMLLTSDIDAGMYDLQVKATLVAGASGSYDGVLVANAPVVPLPATTWLMLGGIGALGAMARKSRLP